MELINKYIKHTLKYINKFYFRSDKYWNNRYNNGGNSGSGSYNHLAIFKAEIINKFVLDNDVYTVIELGCGDGSQLMLSNYKHYIGYDVSTKSIEICNNLFKNDANKIFKLMRDFGKDIGDLAISLDVIYHLVEDNVYIDYMEKLFSSSNKYVIIYSSDTKDQDYSNSMHIKHRKFTEWIRLNKPIWKLDNMIMNKYKFNGNTDDTSFSNFYIYSKI